MKLTYDPKCEVLARHFLRSLRAKWNTWTEDDEHANVDRFARVLQHAAELELAAIEDALESRPAPQEPTS